MKLLSIATMILYSTLCSCVWPGVSAKYVTKSMELSSNVSSFEAAKARMPANRSELEKFEHESDVEAVSPWFTVVRFSRNEKGEYVVYSRKG